MKKTNLLLLGLLLLLGSELFAQEEKDAQDLNLKWSSRMTYSNCKEGFFVDFVGTSDKLVYGISKDYEARIFRWNRNKFEMSLVAFNKESMHKSYHAALKNKKADKARYKKMQGYTYLSTLVMKDIVYVFWKKSTLTQSEIYAESFDVYLNRETKLKKVYTVKHGANKKGAVKRKRRNAVGNLGGVPIVVQNGADSTSFMIGAEIQKGINEAVEFDYVIVDQQFEVINKGHVQLPAVQASKYTASTSAFSFQYGKDGNIYVKGSVRLTKAERKEAKKGEYAAYSILSIIEPVSAEIETYTMKYDGMNIFNFDILTNEDGVKLYGFFNDVSKDPSGSKTHGIFYSNIQDGEMADPTFTYFDAETLNELFKEDPNEKQNIPSKKRKKKPQRINDEESLDESYVIETAQELDKENIVLFCTKVYNYTTITCTSNGAGGGTTCVTNYYCRKRNVTVFKLDNEGGIVWASNIDREKTYGAWNVKDLKIIHDDEKLYVIYGSAFHTDYKRLSGKRSKKRKEVRDQFEYAIFDYATGDAEKKDIVVNQPETQRRERKYISPVDIQVLENKFFVNSTKIRVTPWIYAAPVAYAALSFIPLIIPYGGVAFVSGMVVATIWLATPPAMLWTNAKGYLLRGAGHMGKIELPEKDASSTKK